MSRSVKSSSMPSAGFPRVSGDEPLVEIPGFSLPSFSPRERG